MLCYSARNIILEQVFYVNRFFIFFVGFEHMDLGLQRAIPH